MVAGEKIRRCSNEKKLMKLGRIKLEGRATAAVFDNGQARPIPGYTLLELIDRAGQER